MQALVRGLRERDINGAHILSRAASSREETTCFQDVYDQLKEVLGMGGVLEQLEAEDDMGRNIMMHAARGNHVHVFTQVYNLYETKMMKSGRWDWEDGESPPEKQWKERVKKKDRTGRTMLHHAAEAGCRGILQEVIKITEGMNVYKDMASEDGNDRTPLMLILRNRWGNCKGRKDQAGKFDDLWKRRSDWGWLKLRDIKSAIKGDHSHPVKANTELFHAVRGGPSSLKLFLKYFREEETVITVADALCLEEVGSSPKDLRQYRDCLLLAAAAKGGHVDVMEKVASAIDVSDF